MDSPAAVAVALAHLNAASARSWRLADRLTGGVQSGAWRIESDAGAVAVLKPALSREWATQMLRAERVVRNARAAGYPTPAWVTSGITAEGVGYHVQEFVPGRSVSIIGVSEARSLIEVLERQRGLDPDPSRCWTDHLTEQLGPGRSELRAAVSAIGRAGDALVEACDRLLASGTVDLPRDDLVHGDFRVENVLFDRGQVSGVIDLEAVGSGSRVFDYATLLDDTDTEPAAVDVLVDAAVSIAGPAALRVCFAFVALDFARFLGAASWSTDPDRSTRIALLTERAELINSLTDS